MSLEITQDERNVLDKLMSGAAREASLQKLSETALELAGAYKEIARLKGELARMRADLVDADQGIEDLAKKLNDLEKPAKADEGLVVSSRMSVAPDVSYVWVTPFGSVHVDGPGRIFAVESRVDRDGNPEAAVFIRRDGAR